MQKPDEKGKLNVLLAVILVLASLSLAGAAAYLLQKEKIANKTLQGQLGDIQARFNISEIELQKSKRKISELESKVQQANSQITTLTADLEQEKADKEETVAKVEQLRIDLEQQKDLRSDLEDKLMQVQKDAGKLQVRLKDLESKKIEMETRIKELEAQSKGEVELGKIVVTPEDTGETTIPNPLPSGLEGKILVINKDYDFAVINLGSKDGVGIGNLFSVYHNNKYIGEVKVEKVHDSMAAVGFLAKDVENKITEGDKVVIKTK